MNRLRAYAQLVRLPNVFTAFADIGLGILATWQLMPEDLPKDWVWRALCLLAASGCLYCGGMVFNDVFDLEQDKRERPFRPIPSGRISRSAAVLFAVAAPVIVAEFHLGPRPSALFPYLLIGLGFMIGFPVSRAISRPTASHVQKAVKQAILGLVILDATLASAIAGIGGLAILLLLLPALYLGRWLYST